MTDSYTDIEAAPDTGSRCHPPGILMNLIATLLAPMFLGVTGGDIDFARMAAIETINDYRAHNRADLIAVAQIIAFGLATLGSLSLSMADDLTLSMTLRLRGNANACNRSAEQNRRALAKSLAAGPISQYPTMPDEPETPDIFDSYTDADIFLSAAAASELAAESLARLQASEPSIEQDTLPPPSQIATPRTAADKRHQQMWAIAMVKESSEIAASLPDLDPAEREAAATRAATLSRNAHDLICGADSPPRSPGSFAATTAPGLSGTPPQP